MRTRKRLVVAVALALLACPTGAGALRYRGERVDVFTGEVVGRWVIRTREQQGGEVLGTRVRCRPGRRCGPFRRRLVFDLFRQPGTQYEYAGEFVLDGTTCTVGAYVYDQGFEGTYDCGGTFGSMSGRRGRR